MCCLLYEDDDADDDDDDEDDDGDGGGDCGGDGGWYHDCCYRYCCYCCCCCFCCFYDYYGYHYRAALLLLLIILLFDSYSCYRAQDLYSFDMAALSLEPPEVGVGVWCVRFEGYGLASSLHLTVSIPPVGFEAKNPQTEQPKKPAPEQKPEAQDTLSPN